MVKLIKRTTDNKYLKSVDTETWVDDIKDAFEMTYRECEAAKTALNGVYLPEQLKEIVILSKTSRCLSVNELNGFDIIDSNIFM